MRALHRETHRTDRIGWLRAAVLGANDGIVSRASLVVGVAAANSANSDILITGVAGLLEVFKETGFSQAPATWKLPPPNLRLVHEKLEQL